MFGIMVFATKYSMSQCGISYFNYHYGITQNLCREINDSKHRVR